MNYYEHHLGDYVKDTLYLSMLEDGAYRRLLDAYYIKEEPIPLDLKEAHKRARATSKAERDAVRKVLNEFFEKTADGWRHKRCDEVIAAYLEKQSAAPIKKENDRKRQDRARDRRKSLFEELRCHGVTAPWDATTKHLEETLSRVISDENNGHVTPPVTEPVTRDNTATQYPVTNNQKNKAAAASISSTVDPAGDSPPSPVGDTEVLRPQVQYAVMIRRWERARSKASKLTSSDPRLDVWAKKRITEAQLREAYELAVADRELNSDPTAVGAGFIDVFLAKVLNPHGGESALNRAPASAAEKPWQASWSGIVAKGRELGIEQQEGETPPEFKASVFAAAAMTDEEKSRLRADWGITV